MALQDPPTLREKRPVIVIGAAGDPHAASVVSILKSRGTHTLWLDSRKDIALRFSLGEHPEVSFAGQRPRALFVRHLPPRVPGFVTTAPLGRQERHETLMQGLALREAWVAALSLLEKEGIPLINGAHAFGVDQHKIQQLLWAQNVGLSVPDSSVQRGAFSGDEAVVYKPLLNGEVRESPRDESEHNLVQKRISGVPVRVTMLDGRVLSSVCVENVNGIDHRTSASYQRGDALYSKITPPEGVIAKLRELATSLNLRFHACDFVLEDAGARSDSSWRFLEMNPMPAWLEIEHKTGAQITESLVAALLKK